MITENNLIGTTTIVFSVRASSSILTSETLLTFDAIETLQNNIRNKQLQNISDEALYMKIFFVILDKVVFFVYKN